MSEVYAPSVFERVISRLGYVRNTDNAWTSQCPYCMDYNTLHIEAHADCYISLKCDHGCDLDNILNAISLEPSDLDMDTDVCDIFAEASQEPEPSAESPLDVENLLSHFSFVRACSDGWYAKCPAHASASNNSNMKIRIVGGKALFKCYANCTFSAIMKAAGLRMSEVFEKPLVASHTLHQWETDALSHAKTVLYLAKHQTRELTKVDKIDLANAKNLLNQYGIRYAP